LRQVQRIWRRTVHLETVAEEKPIVLTFDGQASSSREL
jgi:hypothetical protein